VRAWGWDPDAAAVTHHFMPRISGGDERGRNDRESAVTRRRVIRATGTGLTVAAGLAAGSTPVAAETGAVYELFDNGSGLRSRLSQASAAARAGIGRLFADEEKRDGLESARETTTVFNEHSATLVSYANKQVGDGLEKTSVDTIRVTFTNGGETVDRWIVADVDSGSFTGATMTADEPDRDVDGYVELSKLAAADAPDELERFVEKYADEGRAVDAGLRGRLAGRYGPDVETDLM